MIEDLQIGELLDHIGDPRPLQHLECVDRWFLAECDTRSGGHQWHQLLALTYQAGGTSLAMMRHADAPEGDFCLAVFAGNTVVPTYEHLPASMKLQAQQVRTHLKKRWPAQRFTVRVEGARVGTCWTDGPDLESVADTLAGTGVHAHRMTWRRTPRGVIADKLAVLFLNCREAPTPPSPSTPPAAPCHQQQNLTHRRHQARSDAEKIADALQRLAIGRGTEIREVLGELGLAAVAAIVDVNLDLRPNPDDTIAAYLCARLSISPEVECAIVSRPPMH